jgi:hypothetical protein
VGAVLPAWWAGEATDVHHPLLPTGQGGLSPTVWEDLSGRPGYGHVDLDVVTTSELTVQVHTFWTGIVPDLAVRPAQPCGFEADERPSNTSHRHTCTKSR